LLAVIACLLLIKSKNSIGYSKHKIKIFTSGIIFLSISEISIKFFSIDLAQNLMIIALPLFLFFLLYFFYSKETISKIL